MTLNTTSLTSSFKRLCQALPARIFMAVFSAVMVLTLASGDAEAARLGGGRSSGISRSGNVMNRTATPPAPTAPSQSATPSSVPQTPPVAPARSPWMGMLGGLALGAGLGALLGHFGLGGGMGGILMVILAAAAVFFVIRLIRGRGAQTDPLQYAGPTSVPSALPRVESAPMGQTPGSSAGPTTGSLPPGFDAEGFVRQAKVNFVRLQAANDAGNMDDIRAFTTPEMFGEVQLEYQERGRSAQQTDILQLDAQLLDVATEGPRQIASVRFRGSIVERAGAAPEAFDEVWHLSRPADGSSGWVIAGIQQYN